MSPDLPSSHATAQQWIKALLLILLSEMMRFPMVVMVSVFATISVVSVTAVVAVAAMKPARRPPDNAQSETSLHSWTTLDAFLWRWETIKHRAFVIHTTVHVAIQSIRHVPPPDYSARPDPSLQWAIFQERLVADTSASYTARCATLSHSRDSHSTSNHTVIVFPSKSEESYFYCHTSSIMCFLTGTDSKEAERSKYLLY